MSDVVRNYTGSGGRMGPRPVQARGGCLWRSIIATILFLLALLVLTRNSYDAGAFIPAGMRYNVVMSDPVKSIDRIASSNVWNAWPDVTSRDALLKKLRQDPGLPPWILNNLITERLYVAGDDVRGYSDALAITYMSRFGALLERFATFSANVTSDVAGGLRLRHIESSGLYYAVRGRVMIVSPKREVVVRALTLRAEDALAAEERENLVREGVEDARGTVQLDFADPLGDTFQSIAFAVRIDDDRAYAKCHAIIRDTARERFGPLLNGAKPYQLPQPFPGMLEISANFGKPVREVWASLGQAFQSPWLSAAQWQAWETPSPDAPSGNAQAITGLIGPLGPAIRLSCIGIDANEMIPVPLIVGTLQIPTNAIPNLGALPPPPPGAYPWDSYARYNTETKLASLPLVGGPSVEPSAAIYGADLLIGTSRETVETQSKQTPPSGVIETPANLYLRIQPDAIVREGATALRQFAEVGMLRGYDLAGFDEAAKGWNSSAARVKEIVVIASGTDDVIDAELQILCNAPAVTPQKPATP